MSGVPSKHQSGYQKRKKKKRDCKLKAADFVQVGVHANGCDNISAASSVSAVKSTPEVSSTSDDDNQTSASLSTETTNPSSLQYHFQTLELKAKRLKSTSRLPNSIPTFPPTQCLLSVVNLTYECDVGLWQT